MSTRLDVTALPPLDRDSGPSTAASLQTHLRDLILRGELQPGAVISQVELANAFGVSRTPLREALRMLQEEGLVEAEANRRARVVGFDAGELDAVYGCRIMLEPLGAVLTSQLVDPGHAAELERLVDSMQLLAGTDGAGWQREHRTFHRTLVDGAPDQLARAIVGYQDRAERYWLMLTRAEASPHTMRDAEHRAIVEAFVARDAAALADRLARHLARTALTLLAQMAPEHEPTAVRSALLLIGTRQPS